MEKEIVIAIVDLDALDLPELDLPEPEVEQSPPPLPEKFSLDEPEMEANPLESTPGQEAIDLAQLTGGAVTALPATIESAPLANDPPPGLSETATEEILEPASPEPEPIEIEEVPEPEPEPEDLPLEEDLPPAEAPEELVEETAEEILEEVAQVPVEETPEIQAAAEPLEAPEEETREEEPAEPVSEQTLAPEPITEPIAEPEPDTPTKEAEHKVLITSIQKPIEVEKPLLPPPPPPPPPPKPVEEKIKKVGLLGLLKKGKQETSRSRPLLTRSLPSRKKPFKIRKKQKPSFKPAGTEQRIARLKKDVLNSEQQRLMKRPALPGQRHSEIEIVQGAGRNYNIVSSAIQKKSNGLASVYSTLLQGNPKLQGNVLVEFVISPQGRVTKCTILTSSLGSPEFEKTLVREILRWTFRPTKKGRTTVLYPLSFFPSG